MPGSIVLSLTLPEDLARLIRDKVASGEYESESDVVSAGLRQLELPDPVGEAQLRAEIRPAYDAYRAAPSRTVPAERVLDGIQQRYEAARASGRR